MKPSWIEDFQEKTELNAYPVALRTRGGIGYLKPNGDIVSTFVGHPVHYLENGIWKPITLKPHSNGDFEGSDFSWRGKQVFYKGKTLFEPRAVIFNGTRHQLFLRQDGNVIRADLPFGQYTIRFSEAGVREELIILEPIEGFIEFDVPHAQKPNDLIKKDRHIVGGDFGESFQLTEDMIYPLVIDPDYASDSGDGWVQGNNATYATARATSTSTSTANTTDRLGQQLSGTYFVDRQFHKFDTSGITDGDTITDVTMTLTATSDFSNTDFDIQIVKQDWSGQDPLGAGTREAAFDNCLSGTLDAVWRNTSGIAVNTQYTSPSLDTTRVSKTGFTYYSTRSSRDSAGNTPVGNEYIILAMQNNGTSGYRPFLTVTHASSNLSNFFVMF